MRPVFYIAKEQLELPHPDNVGPRLPDTAVLHFARIHFLSGETGPVGDIRGLFPHVCAEALIGRGGMMSEKGTLR